MSLDSLNVISGTCGTRTSVSCHERSASRLYAVAAQERERALEGGRHVAVVTGDPEKDFYSVGRMWLFGR